MTKDENNNLFSIDPKAYIKKLEERVENTYKNLKAGT